MAELEKVIEQVNDLLLLQIPIEEIRLHPDDVENLRMQVKDNVHISAFTVTKGTSAICGVRIVSDETVPIGKMHVVKVKSLGVVNES